LQAALNDYLLIIDTKEKFVLPSNSEYGLSAVRQPCLP